MSSAPRQTLTLVSQDGFSFEIPLDRVPESKLLQEMLELDASATKVPLALDSGIVSDVLTFLDLYTANGRSLVRPKRPIQSPDIVIGSPWCNEWVRSLKARDLLNVIMAANYLDIPILLEVSTARLATKLVGKEGACLKTAINE